MVVTFQATAAQNIDDQTRIRLYTTMPIVVAIALGLPTADRVRTEIISPVGLDQVQVKFAILPSLNPADPTAAQLAANLVILLNDPTSSLRTKSVLAGFTVSQVSYQLVEVTLCGSTWCSLSSTMNVNISVLVLLMSLLGLMW